MNRLNGRDERWEEVYASVTLHNAFTNYIVYTISVPAKVDGVMCHVKHFVHKDNIDDQLENFAFIMSVLIREIDMALDYYEMAYRMSRWPLN